MALLKTQQNWFEVSTEGMRMLQEDRPLWQTTKELISNAWDEDIQNCYVTLQTVGRGLLEIVVEDDGGGFRDISDAYTIFAPTPKQGNASVRGRFNLGEKELLSIARSATVDTVGYTVTFPQGKGRVIKRNKRTSGTRQTVILNGRQDSIAETLHVLRTFIPPVGINYWVNGEVQDHRRALATTEAILATVLAPAPGEPMRRTTRKTSLTIYEPRGERGQIYEIGIPIQFIEMPYDVDIAQKVPLPPNRDVVSSSYLQDVYAEVLTVMSRDITPETAAEPWVLAAVEDDRTPDNVVKDIMVKKLGEKTLVATIDPQANELAKHEGYEVVSGRSLSTRERERYYDVGLETTKKFARKATSPLFGGGGPPLRHAVMTPELQAVARYAAWLYAMLVPGATSLLQVAFISDTRFGVTADYKDGYMRFGVMQVGKKWFDDSPTTEQTAVILHELSHDTRITPYEVVKRPRKEQSHGLEFIARLEWTAAMAVELAQQEEWWTPDLDVKFGLVTGDFDKFFTGTIASR